MVTAPLLVRATSRDFRLRSIFLVLQREFEFSSRALFLVPRLAATRTSSIPPSAFRGFAAFLAAGSSTLVGDAGVRDTRVLLSLLDRRNLLPPYPHRRRQPIGHLGDCRRVCQLILHRAQRYVLAPRLGRTRRLGLGQFFLEQLNFGEMYMPGNRPRARDSYGLAVDRLRVTYSKCNLKSRISMNTRSSECDEIVRASL